MNLLPTFQVAYEYLCRLEEAKLWIEHCIDEEVAPTTELEVRNQT